MPRLATAAVLSLVIGGAAVPAWPVARPASERVAAPGVRKLDLSRPPAGWSSDRLLVKLRDGVRKRAAKSVHRAHGGLAARRIEPFGVDVVELRPGVSLGRAVASYGSDPRVEVVEPNLRRELYEIIPPDGSFADGSLWGLKNVGAPHGIADPPAAAPAPTAAGTPGADGRVTFAWDPATGGTQGSVETVIGIMDSGVWVDHQDLAPSMWRNPLEPPVPDGLDNDANGYIDDVYGCDFTRDDRVCTALLDPPTVPGFDHGTHVAGIAAAATNPGPAPNVVGVCPACRLMVLKVGTAGRLDLDAELRAIAYAKAMGADILTASFGSSIWSRLERDAIAQSGLLMVAAVGNCALDNDMALENLCGGSPSFPASYTIPNILAVAASNHHDEYGYFTGCELDPARGKSDCLFTNWGHDSVDVAAPGVDILSTVPTPPGYAYFTGTSMSAPFAAGVAGLVKARNPAYTAVQVKNAIMNGVDRPPALTVLRVLGRSRHGAFTRTRNGRINANTALLAPTTEAVRATDGNVDGAKRIRSARRGSVRWPEDINDVYRRRLTRGTYRISLDGPRRTDFDLYVWRPGTTEIWQFQEGCFGGPGGCKLLRSRTGRTADEEVARLKVKKRGAYVFHVSAYLFQKGRYRLSIARVSDTDRGGSGGGCRPSFSNGVRC